MPNHNSNNKPAEAKNETPLSTIPPVNVAEGETHVTEPGVGELRVGGGQPSDEVQFTEDQDATQPDKAVAAASSKKAKKEEPQKFGFETTKDVSFTIGGKKTEGTKFEFDSEAESNSRRSILIERYGSSIIKE